MDNPYFEELNSAIQEIVEANGDVLISRNPSQSQEKQNQQIFDMIDSGIDLLFINPVDWKKVTPALIACKNANIPVVDIDTNVFDICYVDSIILSDNYQAGVQIAHDVENKKKTAKIVILSHDSIFSTYERIRGFIETINTFDGDYEIVYKENTSVTLESSMEVMLKFLEENIKFDVIIGGNDPTALGALAAMQKCNIRNDTLIYGIDGSPLGKAMIKQGYMEGTSAQFPIAIGKKSAEIAYNILNGEEVPKKVLIPVELITKKNIEEFDIAGWQ
jgi:ribose transport system substrate-binding protein